MTKNPDIIYKKNNLTTNDMEYHKMQNKAISDLDIL